jgi:hypothetical protein
MTTLSEQRFAQLLTEGVYRIRLSTSKTIQIVQDELGVALGRDGGSAIEYWRKGHLPSRLSDIEGLAREIVSRGQLEREWLEQFLRSAQHPNLEAFCEELLTQRMTAEEERMAQWPDDQRTPLADKNPFIVGPPILNPRHFFGREAELQYLYNLWQTYPLQHVMVIGLRRSGKTSLLHTLRQIPSIPKAQLRPGQHQGESPKLKHFRWVFVDFQDARMCDQGRLLKHLLSGLQLPVPDRCDLYDFLDVVSRHLKRPAVILMDELGAALACPDLDEQFWGSLRSLVSHQTEGRLAFLLTSQAAPVELALRHDHSSPFFNIFGHSLMLGPLEEAEARELVASSQIPFHPADVEWILSKSGRWPSLVQMLCHLRLTTLTNQEIGDAWKAEGQRRIAPYQYLLNDTHTS